MQRYLADLLHGGAYSAPSDRLKLDLCGRIIGERKYRERRGRERGGWKNKKEKEMEKKSEAS